jgi:hypothetical protein
VSRATPPLLLLLVVVVALASCKSGPSSGACTLGPIGKCIEATGDEAAISNQGMVCTETGGTWSSQPCPTENLIGCCDFALGGVDFSECFYTGSPTADPQAVCTTTRAGGVWTPAP